MVHSTLKQLLAEEPMLLDAKAQVCNESAERELTQSQLLPWSLHKSSKTLGLDTSKAEMQPLGPGTADSICRNSSGQPNL